MENKGNTRIKKNENQLDLFSQKSSNLPKDNKSKLTKFSVEYKSDFFSLPNTPTNKAIQDKFNKSPTLNLSNNASLFKYKKNIRESLKRLSKNFIKIGNNKDLVLKIKTLTEKSNEFNNIFNILDTIQTISKDLLKLKIFKGYNFCQILIHERGKSVVDNYFFARGEGISLETVPVQDFNGAFNIFKKSKNKQFSSTSSNLKIVKSMGTFLAKEFNLNNHSIILILSRNDFLPSTKEETKEFYQFSKFLKPLFDLLLLQSLNDERINNILVALNYFPFSAAIMDEYENLLYKNQSFNVGHFSSNIDKYYAIPLADNKKLVIDLLKSNAIQSELHHFQRMSLLGELLNTLQHELNNPLFGISLTSDMNQSESQTNDTNEMLGHISENATRCQKIIKNFSNLYSGSDAIFDINFKELIPEVLKLTKSETKQIEKEIVFINDSDKKDLIVKSNPTWISQILFNLIINASQALKNNPAPKINIFVNKNEILDTLEIAVSDNGQGIHTEIEKEVLKPFFTTKQNGTGLGLSICCNLAEKLNSTISFKNNTPAAGATFSLNLKLS